MKCLLKRMAALLALILLLGFAAAMAEDAHFLLSEKDLGLCKRLTGDVELAVVLVSTPDAAWSQEARHALEENIGAAAAALEEMADGYGVQLNISARYYTADAAQGVGLNDDSGAWAQHVLDGDPSLPDYANSADSRPVIFCLKDGGRAFASSKLTEEEAEYLVLYGTEDGRYALMHELLHLYGAWDYYLHPEVEAAAMSSCPDSLMIRSQAGSRVDSLTAYVIGWTDVLDADAEALLAATAHLTEEDIWLALEEDVQDGFRVIREDGYVYTGMLVSGMYHGWGWQEWDDGSRYEGPWEWGVKQGRGRHTWASGIVYIGDYVNNKQTGQGMMTWPDGAVYIGGFEDGQQQGWGQMRWPSGNCYTGEFEAGQQTGQGTMRWADGAIYTGEFLNGAYHGMGLICYADGTTYLGEFVNGAYHGTGMLCYANGDIYSGGFANNQYHGQGTYAWPDGSLYTGGYANGVYQGYGVFCNVEGTVMDGQWEQGAFVN